MTAERIAEKKDAQERQQREPAESVKVMYQDYASNWSYPTLLS